MKARRKNLKVKSLSETGKSFTDSTTEVLSARNVGDVIIQTFIPINITMYSKADINTSLYKTLPTVMAGIAAYRFLSKTGVKMRLNILNHVKASPRNTKVALFKFSGNAGNK